MFRGQRSSSTGLTSVSLRFTGTPSHPHTLTRSHPHTLTPSHPHTLTPSHPHTLTRSHPHTLTPHTHTPSHAHITTSPLSHLHSHTHPQTCILHWSHTYICTLCTFHTITPNTFHSHTLTPHTSHPHTSHPHTLHLTPPTLTPHTLTLPTLTPHTTPSHLTPSHLTPSLPQLLLMEENGYLGYVDSLTEEKAHASQLKEEFDYEDVCMSVLQEMQWDGMDALHFLDSNGHRWPRQVRLTGQANRSYLFCSTRQRDWGLRGVILLSFSCLNSYVTGSAKTYQITDSIITR